MAEAISTDILILGAGGAGLMAALHAHWRDSARSVLIVEPTMDRATTPADVREAITHARQVYNLYSAADKLTLYEPVDYTRLTNATQDWAVRWMKMER